MISGSERGLEKPFRSLKRMNVKKSLNRSVHIDLPASIEILRNSSEEEANSFPNSVNPTRVRRSQSVQIESYTVISPSLFYQFAEQPQPTFIFDVVMPETSLPFNATPTQSFSDGRFLIYTLCQTSVSTTPLKIHINSQIVTHWLSDSSPIDATDLLMPFGEQQNWLIIETGSFIIPFTLIGIWSNRLTMNELLRPITSQPCSFICEDISPSCPITGRPIEYPAKGKMCQHKNCFDLIAYMNTSIALGSWICPICHISLPLEDLTLGTHSQCIQEERHNLIDSDDCDESSDVFDEPAFEY